MDMDDTRKYTKGGIIWDSLFLKKITPHFFTRHRTLLYKPIALQLWHLPLYGFTHVLCWTQYLGVGKKTQLKRSPITLVWLLSFMATSIQQYISISHIDGLVLERRNSIANALELRLACTNPPHLQCTVSPHKLPQTQGHGLMYILARNFYDAH